MSESAEPGPIAGPAAPRGDEPVDLGVLDGYIYFHLRLAQGAAFRAFKRPGRRSGPAAGLVRGSLDRERQSRHHAARR